MRVVVLLLVCLACCGKGDDNGQPRNGGSASNDNDDVAREQVKFDQERRPEKVVEALKIGPGSRVADVGAGSGLLTVHLARAVAPGGKVVATDIDGLVLDLLKGRLQSAGLDHVVETRIVGPDTPGLEGEKYDAILLAEVDHYFSDPVAWLKTAAKELEPGGRIVISNRVHHRAKSLASAQKAGLHLEAESTPVPTHFIASFVLEKP